MLHDFFLLSGQTRTPEQSRALRRSLPCLKYGIATVLFGANDVYWTSSAHLADYCRDSSNSLAASVRVVRCPSLVLWVWKGFKMDIE